MGISDNLKDDFNKFQEKYNNFMVPSYEITIDGNKLTEKDFYITNIRINLAVKNKAGMANFSISNCYSELEKGFNSEVKSQLKLGSIVKISLGYSNTNKKLFIGYIQALAYEFENIPQIIVSCMDVMTLLMKNEVEERKLPDKTPEEVIKDIFNKYSKFISSYKIDKLQSIDHQIVQNEDDYNFINNIAKENNCDFFAIGEEVYVSNLRAQKKAVATLFYGVNVIHFSREFQLKRIEVTAYGKDDSKNETIIGSYIYETDYPYMNKLKEATEKDIIRSPRIANIDKANKIAKNKAEELIENGYSSKIECIGIPELLPGSYVTLKNFDPDVDGTFYITETEHNFMPGHYRVSLNISN